jgi:hypothetical protein
LCKLNNGTRGCGAVAAVVELEVVDTWRVVVDGDEKQPSDTNRFGFCSLLSCGTDVDEIGGTVDEITPQSIARYCLRGATASSDGF